MCRLCDDLAPVCAPCRDPAWMQGLPFLCRRRGDRQFQELLQLDPFIASLIKAEAALQKAEEGARHRAAPLERAFQPGILALHAARVCPSVLCCALSVFLCIPVASPCSSSCAKGAQGGLNFMVRAWQVGREPYGDPLVRFAARQVGRQRRRAQGMGQKSKRVRVQPGDRDEGCLAAAGRGRERLPARQPQLHALHAHARRVLRHVGQRRPGQDRPRHAGVGWRRQLRLAESDAPPQAPWQEGRAECAGHPAQQEGHATDATLQDMVDRRGGAPDLSARPGAARGAGSRRCAQRPNHFPLSSSVHTH